MIGPRTLLIVLVGAMASAQEPAHAPRLTRLIGAYDIVSGTPIEGAKVTDFATGRYMLTSATGTASLSFLPDGGGYVTVTKIGYESWMQFVRVSAVDTMPITLILKPVTPVLPEIVTRDTATGHISAGMREFMSRYKTGLGHYIVDSVLRKNDNRDLSDVMARVPGVIVSCSKHTPRRCVAHTAVPPMGPCPGGMLLYRDGMRMTDTDLLLNPVSEIGAVEVYSGATMPAEYNMTGASCGAILLWSRSR